MAVVIATRIHLGKAIEPPTDLEEKIASFAKFCFGHDRTTTRDSTSKGESSNSQPDVIGVIAVDADERIAGYNLVESVQTIPSAFGIHVLPVRPWGKFVPALNALIQFACRPSHKASRILFVSAETTAPRDSTLATLQSHLKEDTLVVGAVLPGHDHHLSDGITTKILALTGRTTPWNTLALWDLSKLSLTGFNLVSEGLDDSAMAGIEEVAAIALLQSLFPKTCKAKLVDIQGVNWEQEFSDPARQEWHQQKMTSKLERAAHQLALLGLNDGTVEHIASEAMEEMRFIVTGFGPFDTIQVNPTELICQNLKHHLLKSNSELKSSLLDTVVIETSIEAARQTVVELFPETKQGCRTLVLHLGLNCGGTTFQLERCAYNNASFRVPDQRGFQPQQELIIEGRPLEASLETKLDVQLIAEQMSLNFKGAVTTVSQDPGRFVCNYTYYQSLAMAQDRKNTSSLFLHIPSVSHLQIDDYILYVEHLLEVCRLQL